jgi:hypothetical protein
MLNQWEKRKSNHHNGNHNQGRKDPEPTDDLPF